MTRAEELIKRQKALADKYANYPSYWQDLANFCLPRKGWKNHPRQVGERVKTETLYTSTAIKSLQIMSAGFNSHLTNPAARWFGLQPRNAVMRDIPVITRWFRDVVEIMFSILNATNFDTTMQEFYNDAGCFGTGVIYTQEDPKEKIRFAIIPLESVQMEEDAQGRVIAIYRKVEMTVQQATEYFDNPGIFVTEKAQQKRWDDDVEYLHYIGPRHRREAGKSDNLNMPYESTWIETNKKVIIQEGGYMEFPMAVGRFYKHCGDVFGMSPAMNAIADIKLLNAQQRTMLRAAMKATDPPVVLPDKGYMRPLNFNPGAVNYRSSSTEKQGLEQVPVTRSLPITIEIIERNEENVKEHFFVPLFRAISDITKQMTIPELQRRFAENMVLLGPVIGRFADEVHDPLLVRVFQILYRNGELPPAPEIVQGEAFDPVYLSLLARAQKESEIATVQSFLADVNAIGSVKPGALDLVNEDETVKAIADMRGINPKLIRTDEEVQEIRFQRRQQQQAQEMLEGMGQGAQILKDVASAEPQKVEAR